jgi:Fe-S cluster assembly protein SufB
MSSALSCVGAVAAGAMTGRARRGATSSKRFHANKATSSSLKGLTGRAPVRGVRLDARAEAIADPPRPPPKDAKAEEVRRDARFGFRPPRSRETPVTYNRNPVILAPNPPICPDRFLIFLCPPNHQVDKIQAMLNKPYAAGFKTEIETDTIAKGLSEETVRIISAKKNEPEWMLEFRLKAFRKWLTMEEPDWSDNRYPTIDYQAVSYYSAPKIMAKKQSLDEVDPELLKTFDKLGISLNEQKRLSNVAVDAVFDSVSIATTFRADLAKVGVIFMSISEAIKEYPDLIKEHLGSVVPVGDNYFTALNAAVFSDGSFCYIPKGVRSPMELSTYFRINAESSGQFERTLIVAEEDSYVSYLEGCTAPAYDENQLHAAVVEISAAKNAEVKYSTVQNWYAGDVNGKGGIYNFVTKRGLCKGDNSKISWTQVETGSSITWKYPSVVLKGTYFPITTFRRLIAHTRLTFIFLQQGDNSVGEFFSVALTNNCQQADTGTKMIHIGKNTRSRIVSKGISAGKSRNCYRGLVQVAPSATGARNYSQCDSMLIGDKAGANTYPYISVREPSARVEHEASTSKIGEDQLFYFQQRGIDPETAVGIIISGFCNEVFNELPMEFAAEVNQLMSLKLEGSVG